MFSLDVGLWMPSKRGHSLNNNKELDCLSVLFVLPGTHINPPPDYAPGARLERMPVTVSLRYP